MEAKDVKEMAAELSRLWDRYGSSNPKGLEQELEKLADFYHKNGNYERAIETLEILYRLKQLDGSL
jgi:hypothetical protein